MQMLIVSTFFAFIEPKNIPHKTKKKPKKSPKKRVFRNEVYTEGISEFTIFAAVFAHIYEKAGFV